MSTSKTKLLAISSVISGLLAFPVSYFTGWFGAPFSVTAILLAVISIKGCATEPELLKEKKLIDIWSMGIGSHQISVLIMSRLVTGSKPSLDILNSFL